MAGTFIGSKENEFQGSPNLCRTGAGSGGAFTPYAVNIGWEFFYNVPRQGFLIQGFQGQTTFEPTNAIFGAGNPSPTPSTNPLISGQATFASPLELISDFPGTPLKYGPPTVPNYYIQSGSSYTAAWQDVLPKGTYHYDISIGFLSPGTPGQIEFTLGSKSLGVFNVLNQSGNPPLSGTIVIKNPFMVTGNASNMALVPNYKTSPIDLDGGSCVGQLTIIRTA